MAQTGFIEFDPVRIAEVSGKLEQQHNVLTRSLADIKQKSGTLQSEWRGGSAEAYFSKVAELDQHGTEFARILLAFSQNLAQASGIYKEGETRARQAAEALPTDGVFRV
jgi:WXG100 family type VII secretion target